MTYRCLTGYLLALPLLLAAPAFAAAGDGEATEKKSERISVAVMDFASKGGIGQAQMDSLGDLLANQIRQMGNFRVIGKSDIRATLQLQEQRAVLGCDDEACLAEIGGALGARYMVAGNIGLFGQTYLLNLKLIDVEKVEVIQGVSRTISGGDDQLIAAIPDAAHELMSGLKGVELVETEIKSAGTKKPRPKEGWFVAPGDRSGDFQITVGIGGLVTAPPVLKDNVIVGPLGVDIEAFEQLDSTSGGGWFNLYLGYNPTSWLTIAVRGGLSVAEAADTNRSRLTAEGALSFQGAMMGDSWFQPMAYFDIGVLVMQDKSDEAKTVLDQRIETVGLSLGLGLGFNLYVTPYWFIGARLGGITRIHIMMEHNVNEFEFKRVAGARGYEIGVTAALATGFEF